MHSKSADLMAANLARLRRSQRLPLESRKISLQVELRGAEKCLRDNLIRT